MKNVLAALLKTMVTVALFYLLFRKVDFHEFWATLRTARFNLLLLGFAVLCVGHYVCLFRWRLLMRPLMPVPSLAQLLKIYCIGLFFNLAFPTVVGGDVVKMYYAGKPSRQYAQSFAATILGRERNVLLGSLAISLVNQFLVISVTWLISEALRLDLSILYFLAFVPVVTLVSMIPVSLNGMGLHDYDFRALFSAVGVAPAACL